ncbi:MAG: tyrosine-type recombinase/integrase [Butyrivibrio sp.]|nr:tyrosine-type recombinase/integrase [Butyrivibrio sp.]
MASYQTTRDQDMNRKTQEKLNNLPEFISTYITKNAMNLASTTRYGYISNYTVFFEYINDNIDRFNDKKISDITLEDFSTIDYNEAEDFIRWYSNGRSKSAINRMFSSMSALYRFFIRQHKLTSDPFLASERPKIDEVKMVSLKKEEELKLLDGIANGEGLSDRQKKYHERLVSRDFCIIMLILDTGIKVSELVDLDVDDIDFKDKTITLPYGKNNIRYVTIRDEMADMLSSYLDDRKEKLDPLGSETALFLSRKGTRITPRSVQRLVKKYGKLILPDYKHISPGSLRATFALDLLDENGGDITQVSKALGHEHLSTTSIYINASTNRNSKATQ